MAKKRPKTQLAIKKLGFERLPVAVTRSGDRASYRFVEFFTAQIRNKNTREAYARAVGRFLAWCESHGMNELTQIHPVAVAAYVEQLQSEVSTPTVKQHLAAIKRLFDWLVTGQIIPTNPVSSVRGPKHVVKRGKTPVLTAKQARALLDSIDRSTIGGKRDYALIGVMVFSFARVGAVVAMNVEDYFQEGNRSWFRLREKGGKRHEVPAHHNAQAYVDEYVRSADIVASRRTPLFRTLDRQRNLTERRLQRREVLAMIKRHVRRAGLPVDTCCHTFRATGITTYLENDGTIENAQAIANHASPRTTKLYDRTSDELTLDEVERIRI